MTFSYSLLVFFSRLTRDRLRAIPIYVSQASCVRSFPAANVERRDSHYDVRLNIKRRRTGYCEYFYVTLRARFSYSVVYPVCRKRIKSSLDF